MFRSRIYQNHAEIARRDKFLVFPNLAVKDSPNLIVCCVQKRTVCECNVRKIRCFALAFLIVDSPIPELVLTAVFGGSGR